MNDERRLQVLLVEDSASDARLIVREIERAGWQVIWDRVDTATALLAALAGPPAAWDVVLSDYAMPGFSGLEALAIVGASGLDLPFIIVSGTIGEDTAVAAMKAGAHDYLMKGKLARLVPAIERELHAAEERRQHRRAEANQRLAMDALQLLNRSNDTGRLVEELVRLIQQSLGVDAVGLRLRRGQDFPYYVQQGFADEFICKENFLCVRGPDAATVHNAEGTPVLECMCGVVLSGRADPRLPFFTAGGSFWTNQSAELLARVRAEDPRVNPRNRCIHAGYNSIALIPLRSGEEMVGLLQLNDRRGGRFTPGLIQYLEGLAASIGIALKRRQTQEALASQAREQAVVAELGRLALGGADLDVLFDRGVVRVAETLQVEYCKVLELLPDGRAVKLVAGVGWKEGLVGQATVGVGADSQAGFTLLANEPVIVEDLRTETRFSGPALLRVHGVVSGLSVIIGDVATPFGVLGAHTTSRRVFSQDDVGFLQAVANVLAEATARKRAAAALRDSGALYHSLVENLPQNILRKDLAGRFTFVNRRACEVMGRPREELLGKTDCELFPPELAAKYQQDDQRIMATGETFEDEEAHRMPNGQTRFMQVVKTPLRDAAGQTIGVQVIFWDITEKKKLETQFLRAQRMESVGRLAGGISHDLNNILAPILVASGMLRDEAPTAELRAIAATIESSAQRGADVVKQLLVFARGTEGQKIPVPSTRLVKEMARIVQETFPKSITLRSALPAGLWNVQGDPTRLHQVLLNLCVNARDAMARGGTLTLAAENVTVDECYTRLNREAKAGRHVVLKVADTGIGMPREMLDKIFEPFFTTKGPETGTGLGLATVQGIVRSHAGFIEVESQPGCGSEFRVYLPATPELAAAGAAPRLDLPRGAGELVLVVDDEKVVLEVTRMVLERNGYRVLTAQDGAAAVALYTEHRADVHVVLTDLAMPVMDGWATVRALRDLAPSLKIIATSGAALGQRPSEIHDLPVQAHLPKPFTALSLLTLLRKVMREEPLADDVGKSPNG
jgi:PAS domain S-box-containing protein